MSKEYLHDRNFYEVNKLIGSVRLVLIFSDYQREGEKCNEQIVNTESPLLAFQFHMNITSKY